MIASQRLEHEVECALAVADISTITIQTAPVSIRTRRIGRKAGVGKQAIFLFSED
jgi:hypothetical protein